MATGELWPPDHSRVYKWRLSQIKAFEDNPRLVAGAKAFYRDNPVQFIDHWCDTFDPRVIGSGRPARMPFVMFKRQRELVQVVWQAVRDQAPILVEKARDMGATWVCVSISNVLWLLHDGASVGWGSRKEQLVDRLGDPDSIFEKIRMQVDGFPPCFLPDGFNPKDHATYMKLVNPASGATITGEAGDNIGRGGRKLIYFKDESAHYEHPEKIEAALADNTNIQVDISSVGPTGNLFHRKREAGVEWVPGRPLERNASNIFVMDWRDHPGKDQAWYDGRYRYNEAQGTLHILAREIDRDYSASVEGVIIDPKWVRAALDAHKTLSHLDWRGGWGAGLDVADGGMDRNALVTREGSILRTADEWGDRDTGVTARKTAAGVKRLAPIAVQYDCIGVGAGVRSEINRLALDEDVLPKGVSFVPWNAGASVLFPTSPVNPDDENTVDASGQVQRPQTWEEYAHNLKAQGWWSLRQRFYRTFLAITQDAEFDTGDLISIDSTIPKVRQLMKEFSQPVAGQSGRLLMIVKKTPDGTRSPNMGDGGMMAFWPIPPFEPPVAVSGTYGRTGR